MLMEREEPDDGYLDDGAPNRHRRRRWSDQPLWVRVLERQGLPTLFVLLLLAFGWRVYQDAIARAERQEDRQETRDKALNETMHSMAANVEEQTRTLHELRYLVDPKKKKNAAP